MKKKLKESENEEVKKTETENENDKENERDMTVIQCPLSCLQNLLHMNRWTGRQTVG